MMANHQMKGLMSKTIAVHVHYKLLYVSLSSYPKQQHETTKFCVFLGTQMMTVNFLYFNFELNAEHEHVFRPIGERNKSSQWQSLLVKHKFTFA